MNKKLNILFNSLIIILIIALVVVMINYYRNDIREKVPTNIAIIENDIIPESDDKIIISNSSSGNSESNPIINIKDEEQENIESSGDASENVQDEKKEEIEINKDVVEVKPEINIPKEPEKTESKSPVIMTSENDISSKEKREILGELDKTLMELLEVVDKVQTVDETRLILDDGEVQ